MRNLRQLDRPVRVIKKLLPAFVSLMTEMDVQQGVAFRFDRCADKCHVGLFRSSAAFLDVASCAGTDNI